MEWGPDDTISFSDGTGANTIHSLLVTDIANYSFGVARHYYTFILKDNTRIKIIFNLHGASNAPEHYLKSRLFQIISLNNFLVRRYVFNEITFGGVPVQEYAWLAKMHEHNISTSVLTSERKRVLLAILVIFLVLLTAIIMFTK